MGRPCRFVRGCDVRCATAGGDGDTSLSPRLRSTDHPLVEGAKALASSSARNSCVSGAVHHNASPGVYRSMTSANRTPALRNAEA